jgi:hypothetical protein
MQKQSSTESASAAAAVSSHLLPSHMNNAQELLNVASTLSRKELLFLLRGIKVLVDEKKQGTKNAGWKFMGRINGKQFVMDVFNVGTDYYWVRPMGCMHPREQSKVLISKFSYRKLSEEEAQEEYERTKNDVIFLDDWVLVLVTIHEGYSLMVGKVCGHTPINIRCIFRHPGQTEVCSPVQYVVKMDQSMLQALSEVECMSMRNLIKRRDDPTIYRIASVDLKETKLVTCCGVHIAVKDVEPLFQSQLAELQQQVVPSIAMTTSRESSHAPPPKVVVPSITRTPRESSSDAPKTQKEEDDWGDDAPLSSLLKRKRT